MNRPHLQPIFALIAFAAACTSSGNVTDVTGAAGSEAPGGHAGSAGASAGHAGAPVAGAAGAPSPAGHATAGAPSGGSAGNTNAGNTNGGAVVGGSAGNTNAGAGGNTNVGGSGGTTDAGAGGDPNVGGSGGTANAGAGGNTNAGAGGAVTPVAIEWLPLLPDNGTSSFVRGVSADGTTVIGEGESPAIEAGEAVSWDATAALAILAVPAVPPATTASADANGVSADGSVIVGQTTTATLANQAFIWTAAAGFVLLAPFSEGGGVVSVAQTVSGDGKLIAGYGGVGETQRACFWDPAGPVSVVIDPAWSSTGFNGLDGDGKIAVGAGVLDGQTVGFTYTSTDGFVSIGTLAAPTPGSHAYAISADGTTVVGDVNTAAGTDAIVWTATGGLVSIGTLPGDNNATALAASGDGSVVVGGSRNQADQRHAFVWTAATGMQSLTAIVTASGTDLGGNSLTNALGVSANGKVIVGIAQGQSSHALPYRLTFP